MLKLKETDGWYELDFFAITGYEALRSYGQKPALRLTTLAVPLLKMLLSKKYESLMIKKRSYDQLYPFRFTWWVNLLLRENEGFRLLMADIIEKYGQDKYIFRDIARCIRKEHYCLIPATFREIKKFYTPDRLMRSLTQSRLKIDFNKRSLNYSYYIASLAMQIMERDWGLLLEPDEEMVLSWISLQDLYHCPQVGHFIEKYYERKWGVSPELRDSAFDYAEACLVTGDKMSLRISSLDRLQEISGFKQTDFLIPANSHFLPLKKSLPSGFEWITSRQRLFEEGQKQNNCVFTFQNHIREDRCAIISWEMKEQHYTIEVRANTDGSFRIAQMKGLANSEPLFEDYMTASVIISAI